MPPSVAYRSHGSFFTPQLWGPEQYQKASVPSLVGEKMMYGNRPDHGRHKPKLLDQVRLAIRTRHYSIRTEEAYVQ
jgi:hypothetical protein